MEDKELITIKELKYKIKEIENMNVCDFPINSINRIVAKLETYKINYLILDKRNNYDIEENTIIRT